jgi:hypothetical protein
MAASSRKLLQANQRASFCNLRVSRSLWLFFLAIFNHKGIERHRDYKEKTYPTFRKEF